MRTATGSEKRTRHLPYTGKGRRTTVSILLLTLFVGSCYTARSDHAASGVGGTDLDTESLDVETGSTEIDSGSEESGDLSDIASSTDTSDRSTDTEEENCIESTLHSSQFPVRGTIRGARVDAVLCENGNGVGTFFLSGSDEFTQLMSGEGIVAKIPADVVSMYLEAEAKVSAPEVGTYPSSEHCGWVQFAMLFPIPPGTVCEEYFSPCDPGCRPDGEMFVCVPDHPIRWYRAFPGDHCAAPPDEARGEWQLTLTAVSPLPDTGTNVDFETHGELTATLVNDADPTDTVFVALTF